MEYASLAFSGICTIATIAAAWGMIRTEVSAMKEQFVIITKRLDNDCVGREGCKLRHDYVERDMKEIKDTLGVIKRGMDEQHSLLLQLLNWQKQ